MKVERDEKGKNVKIKNNAVGMHGGNPALHIYVPWPGLGSMTAFRGQTWGSLTWHRLQAGADGAWETSTTTHRHHHHHRNRLVVEMTP